MPRGEETRRRLLMAGMELFARHGYEAVSVKEIGEQVGIRGASIYNHFASKAEILEEITRLYQKKMEKYSPTRQQVDEAVAQSDPEKVLELFAYDYTPEDKPMVLQMQRLTHLEYHNLEKAREVQEALTTKNVAMLEGAMERLAQQGVIAPVTYDLGILLRMLSCSMVMLGLEATQEGGDWDRLQQEKERAFALVLDIVRHGLKR